MSVKAAEKARAAAEPAGDCIDCKACVNACPTGVDIRDGIQLGCIQCGLCIDACDTMMERVGREPGLDRLRHRHERRPPGGRQAADLPDRAAAHRALRRLIAVVGAMMLYTLATRDYQGINVLHDRNPIAVRLTDGGTRNGYTVRLLNKRTEPRTFTLAVEGLPAGTQDRGRSAWSRRRRGTRS